MNSFSIPTSADNRLWTPLTDDELVEALLHEQVRLPPYQQLLESLPLCSGMSVLEYGCGAGEVAGLLASQEDLDVQAFDPVEAMRQSTRGLVSRYCGKQIPIYGTTSEIPDGHFDIVVSYLVACILDDPALQEMLSAVRAKMKNSGLFHMVICNPNIAACEWTAIDHRFPKGLDFDHPCLLPKMKLSGARRAESTEWQPYGVHERHRPEGWWGKKLLSAGYNVGRKFSSPDYSIYGDLPDEYQGRVIPGDYLAFECTMA